MKFLVILGTYLVGLLKGLATFFLSGGGIVFSAVALFASFVTKIYSVYNENVDVVAGWIDKVSEVIQNLQDLDASGNLAGVFINATAVDSLVSYLTSFTSVVMSLLCLIGLGVLSFALAIAFPFVAFRVIYFIKQKVSEIST